MKIRSAIAAVNIKKISIKVHIAPRKCHYWSIYMSYWNSWHPKKEAYSCIWVAILYKQISMQWKVRSKKGDPGDANPPWFYLMAMLSIGNSELYIALCVYTGKMATRWVRYLISVHFILKTHPSQKYELNQSRSLFLIRTYRCMYIAKECLDVEAY